MPKESQQPQRRKPRFVVLLTVALSLTSIALGTWALATRDRSAQNEVAPDVDFSDLLDTTDFDAAASLDDRPVYRYSVIPGGVYSADDLRHAIHADPMVAAHYQDLDQSKLQVRTIAHDQYAYVSYRKGDEVLWTRSKVLLRQGETIITDGTKQVRAKCGNCISLEPQLPTAADEPEVVEFDRLVDPDPASVPAEETEVALVPPASPVAAGAPPAALLVDPVEPLAAGQFAGGSSSPLAAGNPGTGNDPDVPGPPVDVPGPDTPLTPFTPVPPVFLPTPPGGSPTPPGNPLPPLTDDPPREEPPFREPPTDQPPGEPSDPVPVPEPGTLLLVGGGVAVLIRRLRARVR